MGKKGFLLAFFTYILALTAGFHRVSSSPSLWSRMHVLGSSLLTQKSSDSTEMTDVNRNDLDIKIKEGPIPIGERQFEINGWRWHTGSVIRDLNRFRVVVDTMKKTYKSEICYDKNDNYNDENRLGNVEKSALLRREQATRAKSCSDFVCGFNWKALIKVESELFFPWLSGILPDSANALMKDLLREHKKIEDLSKKMAKKCDDFIVVSKSSTDTGGSQNDVSINTSLEHLAYLYDIDEQIVELQQCALRIQDAQEHILVPYVCAYVTKKEQDRFNKRVISRLGLLDSQIHLVSMLDCVKDNREEALKYKQQIPKVARALIPVWRTRLYMPKAACLDLDVE